MNQVTDTIADHAIRVYEAMENGCSTDNGTSVYEGSLSNLLRELNISLTYYSPIFRVLHDHGYVAMMDRGGRNKPSRLLLLQHPRHDELVGLPIAPRDNAGTILNRLDAIERSLAGANVVGVLKDHEDRLLRIEVSLDMTPVEE